MSTQSIVPGKSGLQSEGVFRHLVEGVAEYAIFLLDTTGHIASWNAGAERIKQYKASEIIGSHFSRFYGVEDNAAGKPAYELKVAGEVGRFEDEGWRVRKDGSRFWANVVITRILGDDGKLIGFGKITRDLTERRVAEQRYRLLIEGVTDYAIYSLDISGKLTSWNAGAQRIKGYNDFEIIGQHFSRFYEPADVKAGVPEHVLRTAQETGHYEGEGWRVRKDGSRFWSSVVVTPIRNDQGELIGFSKITRDVTDRKILLDQIRQHAEELELRVAEREQTNAELEAFSYSVSHDLRAPLRAIEGFTQAFIEDYGSEVKAEGLAYLKEVTSAAERMNHLVQDLLNFSRLSRIQLDLKSVAVADAVKQSVTQLSLEKNVMEIEVPADLTAIAHEATLIQAISNLMSNGLKFQQSGMASELHIRAEKVAKKVRIEVRDNGIGIAPEHLDRIFQVFERLHGQEQYPGTGIGLAIVKRGIQRMGGDIGVESKLGQGSTFWIELPWTS
jgi:PAS domain S-box-containing protein